MRKASSHYKKLLTAKIGDVFVLKGKVFKVWCFNLNQIALTSLDKEDDIGYSWIHVRNREGKAVFKRQELIDLLRSGKYVVD